MRWTLAVLLAGCGSSATPMVLGEAPALPEKPAADPHAYRLIDQRPDEPLTADQAAAWVARHASEWGTAELVEQGRVVDATVTSIQYVQKHYGIPVRGGHLGLTIERGNLVLVQGVTFPVDGVDPIPRISGTAASLAADGMVRAAHDVDRDEPKLEIVDGRLVW